MLKLKKLHAVVKGQFTKASKLIEGNLSRTEISVKLILYKIIGTVTNRYRIKLIY